MTTATRSDLGDRLVQLRREKHISQRALSNRSGISRSYLCDIERGRATQPSHKVIAQIAEVLEIPPAHLSAVVDLDKRSAEIRKVSGDLYQWLSEGHRLVRTLEALGLT